MPRRRQILCAVWRQFINKKIRVIPWVAMLALMLSLVPFASVAADETDNGVIQGQVINITSDGTSSTADVEVTLRALDMMTGQELDGSSVTVQTDVDGNYTFDTLSTDAERLYEVRLTFLSVVYTNDYLAFAAEETSKTADINVYETTESDELIYIARSSSAVYAGEETEESLIPIFESYMIANNSDRVYIGTDNAPAEAEEGSKEVLRFTLPTGATNVSYVAGLVEGFVFDTDDGFVSTLPVKPGHPTTIDFAYYLETDGNTLDFSRNFHYPLAGSYVIAVQDTGTIKVTSTQLASNGTQDAQGSTFILYAAESFSADTVVTASINLAATNSQTTVIWFIVILVVAAAGIGGGYLFKRKRPRDLATVPIVTAHTSDDTRQKLLLEIAALDDQFAAETISKQEYDELRVAKKQQLVELIRGAKSDAYGE
ncbi:MAG: hypothetical protein HN407_06825 [Chloroflexi bacterium]|nr:hypothetical protein [Chloroflexota bacterium]